MHRRYLIVLIALLLLFTSSAQMELIPLPLDDDSVYGQKPQPEGFLSPDEYKDASIHVRIERFEYKKTPCMMILIDIAHPSQIRTTKSSASFIDREMVVAQLMAKKARAVFAVNGDFFKYNVHGFTIRQQHEVRKGSSVQRLKSMTCCSLMIWAIFPLPATPPPTARSTHGCAEASGRTVVNTFTFGPLLIENGQIQAFDKWLWEGTIPMQRVAIGQLGPLSYGVFHCGGATKLKTGLTMNEFAQMILEKQPDARMVYNLDGGGSTSLVFNNEKINTNWDVREICDMIYFASIDSAGAAHE